MSEPQWCGGDVGPLSHSQDIPQHPGDGIQIFRSSYHFTPQIPSLRIHVILWLDYNHSKESYHVLRYGEMRSSPLWGKVIVNLNHLLLALSSAVNILIYSYKVSIQTLTIQDHSVQVTNNSGLIFLQVSSPYLLSVVPFC